MIDIVENLIPLSISFLISILIYMIIDRNCFFTNKINLKLKFDNRYKTGIVFLFNLFFVFIIGILQIFYKNIVSRDIFGIIVGASTGFSVIIVSRLETVMYINQSNDK